MFMFYVYLLCKISVTILSHCHLKTRSAFNWPTKQTSLGLSKKKAIRKERGSFRLPEDLRFSSYEKAIFPSERMPTFAPGYKCNKCCMLSLCWSCSLQWKAHKVSRIYLPGSWSCQSLTLHLWKIFKGSWPVILHKKLCADLKTKICFWGGYMCCLPTLRTVKIPLKQQPLKLLQQVLVVGFLSFFFWVFRCIGELLEF